MLQALALHAAASRRTTQGGVLVALVFCLLTPQSVHAQDLIVSALSNPPAAAPPGGSFQVSETTRNQGLVNAPPTTTKYYLSSNTIFNTPGQAFGDYLLSPSRAIPSLGPNETSSALVTLTVPTNQPTGPFYLLACADHNFVVSEPAGEGNNCRASITTVQLTRPDLVVDSVTNPPLAAIPGSSFVVSDTVRNQGPVDAFASTAGYFLSVDAVFNPPGQAFGDWPLTGNRSVPALAPGATSTGTLSVTIPAGLSPVTYYLIACADAALAVAESSENNNCRASTTRVTLTSSTSANPFGGVDTPVDNSVGVTGAVAFTGWALDDGGVTSLSLCRAPVNGESAPLNPNCAGAPQIAVGNPVFIQGARPDIAAAYPSYPNNTSAGWGFMVLTNMLPNQGNGPYVFYVYAGDADGHVVMLGSRTMTCDNANATKPFGAIDTPTQGGVASGSSFFNFGWALTPLPKTIPIDGSTIIVYVDGAPIGHPSYNNFRSDIATLFPGLNNSNGAIGVLTINTTTLANGLHTIAWSVTDNQGITEGIGSRFFTVSNAAVIANGPLGEGSVTVNSLDLVNAVPQDPGAITGRRGWSLDAPWRAFSTARTGRAVVRAEELDRIELSLGGHHGERYTGYQRLAGDLEPLPIGSRLDGETGLFTWAPGVGFVGAYDLVFVRWAGSYPAARHEVQIVLEPKKHDRR